MRNSYHVFLEAEFKKYRKEHPELEDEDEIPATAKAVIVRSILSQY
jgi:hypothetical protein